MFNGYDFVYDGKSSISENLKLLNTDGEAFKFEIGIPQKNINLYHSNQSSRWHIGGVTMDEPLSFPIQIMLHGDGEDEYDKLNPILERNRLSRITHWLFDNTQFKKLQILTDDMRDLYFMAVFKDAVELFEDGGEVRGFRATVLCDTYGAYEEKTITKTSNGSLTFALQCLQDGIFEVAPVYKIDMIDGNVKIRVNDEDMIFNALTPGSTVTIDTEKIIAKSSEGDNLFTGNRFNRVYPNLVWGKNVISIEGNCKLSINYKLIREVGC